MMRGLLTLIAVAIAGASTLTADTPASTEQPSPEGTETPDSLLTEMGALISTVLTHPNPEANLPTRYESLTDEDFRIVAEELGVEQAAIKAVARIEAGAGFKGFCAPGVPIVNYSQPLFAKYRVKTKSAGNKEALVPTGLTGYQRREWTALTNARKVNEDAANMATYWGMFQIGGAHYRLCGCRTIGEMVELASDSEFSQLEMFATFIRNSGMLESLRNKDWAAFARKYNGPSYAKRGYHTRMAREYAAFKAQETEPAERLTEAAASTDSIASPKPATKKKASTARKKKRRTKRRR